MCDIRRPWAFVLVVISLFVSGPAMAFDPFPDYENPRFKEYGFYFGTITSNGETQIDPYFILDSRGSLETELFRLRFSVLGYDPDSLNVDLLFSDLENTTGDVFWMNETSTLFTNVIPSVLVLPSLAGTGVTASSSLIYSGDTPPGTDLTPFTSIRPAPVPLPAPFWMLLVGLIALMAASFTRSRT